MLINPHQVLTELAQAGPEPRISWLGNGEQLELSGYVVANWASKIANLLVDEGIEGPRSRVRIDLPPHWRTATWALGVWLTGACVVLPSAPDAGSVDLVVSAEATDIDQSEPHVVVPLASFALRYPGTLPPGALDGAADVAAHPDTLGPTPAFEPDNHALHDASAVFSFRELSSASWFAVNAVTHWHASRVASITP